MAIRRCIHSLLALLWAATLVAQPPAKPEVPDFIRWDDNMLFRDSDKPLLLFFRSLDSLIMLGDRKVGILHLGDSHVQAGYLSNELRVQFQRHQLLGNGGRGMVFPYKLARTNGPVNYGIQVQGEWTHCKMRGTKSGCTFGIAGYSATTTDTTARITVSANHRDVNPEYRVERVRVYHRTGPGTLVPNLIGTEVRNTVRHDHFTEFVLARDTNTFTIGLSAPDSLAGIFELHGIGLENDDPGVVLHDFGVNGSALPDWLTSDLLEAHLRALDPTLIIISLGTNDAYTHNFDKAAYKVHYATLMQRLKTGAPHASIILTTPGDSYVRRRYPNRNVLEARNAIFELAHELELSVWDFFTVMGGPGSIDDWHRTRLATADKLHLTEAGYSLQGRLLFEAIMTGYYQYLDNPNGTE